MYGKEDGNEVIKKLIADEGLRSTSQMTKSVFRKVMEKLEDEILASGADEAATEAEATE